jgi:hypothetical protein
LSSPVSTILQDAARENIAPGKNLSQNGASSSSHGFYDASVENISDTRFQEDSLEKYLSGSP